MAKSRVGVVGAGIIGLAVARRLLEVEPAPAGMHAQAPDPDGSLVDDFRITIAGGLVLVRDAPSPAATSSLAIAEHVVDQLRAAWSSG